MSLTLDEMQTFRLVCRTEDVDPTRHCPLCRADAHATRKAGTGYCDTHKNWTHEDTSITVRCGSCGRSWSVVGPITCDGAGDGQPCQRRRFGA